MFPADSLIIEAQLRHSLLQPRLRIVNQPFRYIRIANHVGSAAHRTPSAEMVTSTARVTPCVSAHIDLLNGIDRQVRPIMMLLRQ